MTLILTEGDIEIYLNTDPRENEAMYTMIVTTPEGFSVGHDLQDFKRDKRARIHRATEDYWSKLSK